MEETDLVSLLNELLSRVAEIRKEMVPYADSEEVPRFKVYKSRTAMKILSSWFPDRVDMKAKSDMTVLVSLVCELVSEKDYQIIQEKLYQYLGRLLSPQQRLSHFRVLNRVYREKFKDAVFKLNEEDLKVRQAEVSRAMERNMETKAKDPPKASQIKECIEKGMAPSASPSDFLIAAGLATGARLIEIIALAEFSVSETRSTFVVQKGTTQKGNHKGVAAREHRMEKPLLFVAPSVFLERLAAFREKVTYKDKKGVVVRVSRETAYEDEEDRQIISGNFSRLVCPQVKELFQRPDYSFHSLRSMYVNLSYAMYGEKQGLSKPLFLARMLGHRNADGSASFGAGATYQSIVPVLSEEKDLGLRNDLVSAKTQGGEVILLQKRDPNAPKGTSLDQLKKMVSELQAKDVKVTTQLLLQLGWGRSTISVYKKENKEH